MYGFLPESGKGHYEVENCAIITHNYSGRMARNLAAFRGKYPVLAICYKEKTMRHLALSYGVEAIYMPELANGQEYYFAALRRLLQEGRCNLPRWRAIQ